MRHHLYNPTFRFVREPEEFNKYTEREILQYCLGATMYMPGYKDFTDAILYHKYPGLTSMVMCFEDACKEEDVSLAETNSIRMLNILSDKLEAGEFSYKYLPLLIFRVRNLEQFKHFASQLSSKHIKLIAGFNFPKFNKYNGLPYFAYLKELNKKFGEIIYECPSLRTEM